VPAGRCIADTNDGRHVWYFRFPDGYVAGAVPCDPVWQDGREPDDTLMIKSAETIALGEAKGQKWF
jgi:hypothetical protein